MNSRRFELPGTRTLVAFEAAARLGSITRAAEELATSHSAVSRHIRALEKSFEVTLFERRGRGVALTTSGEAYLRAVRTGLDALRDGGRSLRNDRTVLAIGGTLEITALLLHPVWPQLQSALGDEMAARIVVYDYDLLPLLMSFGLDVVFEAKHGPHPDPQAVPVLDEALVPVASKGFAKRHATGLAGDPRTWRGVPRLDIGRPGSRLGHVGHVVRRPRLRRPAGTGADLREPFQPAVGRGQRRRGRPRMGRVHEQPLRDGTARGGQGRVAEDEAHDVRPADREWAKQAHRARLPRGARAAHRWTLPSLSGDGRT